MSYPTQQKETMKMGKRAARYLLKHESAWQAHLHKECLNHCWYCLMQRRMDATGQQ